MKRAVLISLILGIGLTLSASAQTNPRLVADIYTGNDPGFKPIKPSREVMGGVLFFHGDDGSGEHLWRIDAGGTSIVHPVTGGGGLVTADDLLYFIGITTKEGAEPWRSDGTQSGSFLLKNIRPRSVGSGFDGLNCFVATQGRVFFKGVESYALKPTGIVWRIGLYTSDGSTSGTVNVTDFYWIERMTALDGLVIIEGSLENGNGWQIYRSDGTSGGTALVGSVFLRSGENPYTNPDAFHMYEVYPSPISTGRYVFMTASDGVYGNELWRTDGYSLDMCTDINPGNASSYPLQMTVMGDYVYFTALSPTIGTELWRYPVNGNGTGDAELVKDICPGDCSSEPLWLTAVDGTLYFSAYTATNGRELWKSDGTPLGTVLVTDINPAGSSNPEYPPDDNKRTFEWGREYRWHFASLGCRIYFAADEGTGYQLWESDGSPGGTRRISDINPGNGCDPRYITPVGSEIYFTAYDSQYGDAWWAYSTGANLPPHAVANATPTSGAAPLDVDFSSAGSLDPDGIITSYAWDFGDGGTSYQPNSTHTFMTAGIYNVQLIVTDNDAATALDHVTITVTTSSSSYVYVANQTVDRITAPGNKWRGQDVILILDDTQQPVEGAIVSASYDGPNTGTTSGTTASDGTVTLTTGPVKNPSGDWCFTVIDVQSSGIPYNDSHDVVNPGCEPPSKAAPAEAVSPEVLQIAPNPLRTSAVVHFSLREAGTVILDVYDLLGRQVATLTHGPYPAGTQLVRFEAPELPSGYYICRLLSGGKAVSRLIRLEH